MVLVLVFNQTRDILIEMVESGQHSGLWLPRNPGAVGASCGRAGKGLIACPFLPSQTGSGETYNLCLCFESFPGDVERPRQGWDVVLQMGLAQRQARLWGVSQALLHHWSGNWWLWVRCGVLDFEQSRGAQGTEQGQGGLVVFFRP